MNWKKMYPHFGKMGKSFGTLDEPPGALGLGAFIPVIIIKEGELGL